VSDITYLKKHAILSQNNLIYMLKMFMMYSTFFATDSTTLTLVTWVVTWWVLNLTEIAFIAKVEKSVINGVI
jgi:hypothetical protein